MRANNIDELVELGNRDKPDSGKDGLLCQVNFKSGNRMMGTLFVDGSVSVRYRLLSPAQTQVEGRPADAIAEHHFDPDDVEAIVLLYPIKQSAIIS